MMRETVVLGSRLEVDMLVSKRCETKIYYVRSCKTLDDLVRTINNVYGYERLSIVKVGKKYEVTIIEGGLR